jgi:hypothetical protein
MNKELQVVKIMDKERCSWEEAIEKEKERKKLNEFF